MLNHSQEQAVGASDRFLMLLAGAGTGKTRVIISRIRKLLDEGRDPKTILGMTFTRKAALEMERRIGDERIKIRTFHGFCYDIVTEDSDPVMLYDGSDDAFSRAELLRVTVYKNGLMRGHQPKVYETYEKHLRAIKAIDYDDLMLKALKTIRLDPKKWSFGHLLIDEFQDTNLLQFEIINALINSKTSVFVVGDPDQSIYRFRGANQDIIRRFVETYDAKVLKLESNYRSKPHIIASANRLITHNRTRIKKTLYATQTGKVHAVLHHVFSTIDEEANAIVIWIKETIRHKVRPEQIAILFRTHARAYALEERLIREGIDYESADDEGETVFPAVQLMTIHRAKGLEFEAVVIMGLEEGVLPSNRENRISETEEERRLMFVGITRARTYLFLTSVQINDQSKAQKTSRFVFECGAKTMINPVKNGIMSMGDFDGRKRTYRLVERDNQPSQ
ncbi:MAG: ATP-dependent helicase [Acholeplasmataceae bacterium]|nr:ATP-dependent helicase [Acholeplasmataceae bacterium]